MRSVRGRSALSLVLLGAAMALPAWAWAQDLPAADPDRAAILAAVNDAANAAPEVKRMVKAGGYAFVRTLMNGLPMSARIGPSSRGATGTPTASSTCA